MKLLLKAALIVALVLVMAGPAFAAGEPNPNSNCNGRDSTYYAGEPFPDYARDDYAHYYNQSRKRLGYNMTARDAVTDCNQKPYPGPWEGWVYG